MRTIRLGSIVITAILALAATAFAQAPQPGAQTPVPPAAPQNQPAPQAQQADPGPSSPAGQIASRLAQELNLTNEQTVRLRSVLEDEHGKMIALREDATLSDGDKQAQLLAIRQKASDDVMSILTPEQQKKLVDLLQGEQQGQAESPGKQPPQSQQVPSTQPQQVPPPQPPPQA